MTRGYEIAKRAIDIVASAAGLVLTAPLPLPGPSSSSSQHYGSVASLAGE